MASVYTKRLVVLMLFCFGCIALACGGGGSSTSTTSGTYSRSPGMSAYLSALEGDYRQNIVDRDGVYGDELGGAAPPTSQATADDTGSALKVFEPDLYTVVNDLLFAVNTYRGLMIIDISDPENLEIAGTLPFRGSPRNMFVKGTNLFVVLDDYITNTDNNPVRSSALIKVDFSTAVSPEMDGVVTFDGTIADCRMAGDAVYVVTSATPYYGPVFATDRESNETFWGVKLSSVNTLNMTVAKTANIAGYVSAIQGGENKLVLAASDYNTDGTTLYFYDISSSTGQFTSLGTFSVEGWVADKFKLHFENGFCFAISHSWADGGLSYFSTIEWTGNTPSRAARLTLARGEQQFASRFDTGVCYLVTFEQIDPLWIIDLSTPRTPVIAGELELPGWSIYLEPDGERLIAVGYDSPETRRVQASLFDVSDLEDPTLISQVVLGDEYGWTPIDGDDKAFTFLQDEGLLVVPVIGYGNAFRFGYAQHARVSLISYNGTTLRKRGAFDIGDDFKRSFAHNDSLFAFTSVSLVAYDISDLDDPTLLDELTLVYNVLAVEPITNGFRRVTSDSASVSFEVISGTDPNAEPTSTLKFKGASYFAFFNNGNYAYLLLNEYGEDYDSYTAIYVINASTNPPVQVGKLKVESSFSTPWYFNMPIGMAYYPAWGDVIQVKGDLLALRTSQFYGIMEPSYNLDRAPSPQEPTDNLLLIDLSTPATPAVSARIGLPYGASEPYVANGLIYLSYFASHGRDDFDNYTCRHYVVVVDPTNRANPTVSDPINTPGRIVGVSGNTLFCLEGIYKSRDSFSRLFNAANITEGKAVLLDSLEVPDKLWNITIGSDGKLAAGITCPNYYYFYDYGYGYAYAEGDTGVVFSNGPVRDGDDVAGGSNSDETLVSKLYVLDISKPNDLKTLFTTDMTSYWAEIVQVTEPYLFIMTDWQMLNAYEIVNSRLVARDSSSCGYYSNSIEVLGTNAYLPGGYFGVVVLNLGN